MSAPRARKILRYAAMLDAIGAGDAVPPAARRQAQTADDAGEDIPLDAYVALLERIAEQAPPDFALRFGGSRRLVDLGVVGHAILSCETLRQAHAIWQRFSGLAGDPVTYRTRQSSAAIRDEIIPAATLSPRLARFCAEEWVASFCHFAQETIGSDCAGIVLELRHKPVPGVDYAQLTPRYTIHAVTAEDDRVAVDCEGEGRFRDGTPYRNTYHFLFRLRDGRIVSAKEFLNTAYMSQTLADQFAKAERAA